MGADYLQIRMWVATGSVIDRIINGQQQVTATDLAVVLADGPDPAGTPAGWEELSCLVEEDQAIDPDRPTVTGWARICAAALNAATDLSGRDCAHDPIGPGGYLLSSGGLSWGDPPTHAYQVMSNLSWLPGPVLRFAGISFTDPGAQPITVPAGIDPGLLDTWRNTLAAASEHQTDPPTSEALLGVLNLLDTLTDHAGQHPAHDRRATPTTDPPGR